jgi:hypothetical protein
VKKSFDNLKSFFRGGFACATASSNYKTQYYGFIGFTDKHEFFNSAYKNVGGVGLSHYNIVFNNDALDKRWWLGFCTESDATKSLEKLKLAVDLLSKDSEDNDSSSSSGPGFKFLLSL